MITLGLDPGARYTAAVVRDADDVLLASTFVRDLDTPPFTWALQCVRHVREEVLALFPQLKVIGIEGIQPPRGFSNGKVSMIQPAPLIFMAMVAGALAADLVTTHDVVIVPAKKNGSGDYYPASLNGPRPKDLLGSNNKAGTRKHEKSAYDIAGEVPLLKSNRYHLDAPLEL